MSVTDGNFLLEKTLRVHNPALMNSFRNISAVMYRVLEKIPSLFSDFTDHAGRHALTVIDFLDRMIGEENIGKLNDDEIYILLCSAYLHDLGMTIDEQKFQKLRDGIVPEDYFVKNPGSEIRDAIRAYHQIFSQKMILGMSDFFEFATPEHGFCVAEVCLGHRSDDLFNAEHYNPSYKLPNGNTVHLPYLAALMRLADELDIAIDRNPIFLYDEFRDVPAYKKHFAVKHLWMKEDSFSIEIETTEESVKNDCLKSAKKLADTLSYCVEVTERLTPFTISQKSLHIFLNGEQV